VKFRAASGGLLAGAGVLLALVAAAPPVAAQPGLSDRSVTVVITDMTPTTPKYTEAPSPLTITLLLTNTTDQPLYNVTIDVERDAQVIQEKLLAQLMADPAPSQDQSQLSPLKPLPIPTLAPHERRPITYHTTTSSAVDGGGICLCFESGGGVYPINFTVSAAPDPDAGTTVVGFGQTYLPAFKDQPQRMRVSWVWPLIDRPHRLLDGTSFTDDDLATSVSPGGRLFDALTVVERVVPSVHLTLMIDPELLDELATMSQPYHVISGGKTVDGKGTAAAQAWLKRLKSVVTSTQVSLTPYSDPDIDAVTAAGLNWSDTFGPDQVTRTVAALGMPATTDTAWPPRGVVTSAALQRILARGTTSEVVLSDTIFPGTGQITPKPDALAPLPAQFGASGTVAAVTDSTLQTWSARTLTAGGSAALPQLASDLAVRAAEQSDRSHYVVITAPRYVDVDPGLGVRTLLETARTSWSTSATLDEAARTTKPVDHGRLVEPSTEGQLPPAAISAAQSATRYFHSFATALNSADATALLGGLPAAVQRAESAAWQVDPARGVRFAQRLTDQVGTWQRAVHILRPSSGTYTLASTDSPLPITVVNGLPVDVRVRVRITTANGVSGFRSDERVQTIPRAASPNSPTRSTLKIQTHVQRAGTFQVDALLLAPDGTQLGSAVPLSIHCTALGAVGVIITAVAGGLLVLALAYRVHRRLRARAHRPTAEAPPREPAGIVQ
jgi:Family of unknown function (DUF6049)